MRKKWKTRGGIVLLLVGFMLSIGSVSWAGSDPYGSKIPQTRKQWTHNQREKRFNLNLTPEQRMKLTRLSLFFREQTVDLRAELAKRRIEFQRLWLKRMPNQAKMYSLIDEISEIRAQISKNTVDFILRVKDILTPEQLKKLFLLKVKFR